jgi:hypothetical protein
MLKCERLGGLVLMDLMLNGDSKLLLRFGSEASPGLVPAQKLSSDKPVATKLDGESPDRLSASARITEIAVFACL